MQRSSSPLREHTLFVHSGIGREVKRHTLEKHVVFIRQFTEELKKMNAATLTYLAAYVNARRSDVKKSDYSQLPPNEKADTIAEARFFLAIKGMSDPVAIEAILKQHPNSPSYRLYRVREAMKKDQTFAILSHIEKTGQPSDSELAHLTVLSNRAHKRNAPIAKTLDNLLESLQFKPEAESIVVRMCG